MNMFFKRYIIRIFLLGCFLFHLGVLQAQTYYVSSINGDDRNAGTSPATAWKTIDEVNRQLRILRPGNSVLFERGGIYYGTITIPSSVRGLADYPITFGAYGVGEMPVISGAKQITNWEQVDKNLWQAQVPERPGSIDVLFIDGKKYYPARFPNKGYRTVTNQYSRGLQDNTLRFPDGYWNGAAIVYKKVDWEISRGTVSYSYNDGRVNIGVGGIEPNWGYFFQNHINALDTIGEYVFDKQNSVVTLSILGNPNEQIIEYMNASFGIDIHYSMLNCYINIEDLCFQHYRGAAINARYGGFLTIRRNVIKNAISAMYIAAFNNCLVSENTIIDMENNGIELGNLTNTLILNNTIRRVAVSLDAAIGGIENCNGIVFTIKANLTPNDHCEIIGNRIDSIGYNGIRACFSQNLLIKNNVINHSMLSLSDGGGIYIVKTGYDQNLLNNKIIDNIVLNTIGNNDGTPWNTNNNGIYLDDDISNLVVDGNTIFNSGRGIFFHGSTGNLVHNNVLYNNANANVATADSRINSFLNNDLQYNYIYGESLIYLINIGIGIDGLATTNKIDNNFISAPFNRNGYISSLNGRLFTRTEWSSGLDFDLHSRAEPVSYALSGAESPKNFTTLVYNPTPKDSVILLDHTYMSFDSIVHAGSILLNPFKSAILFRCKDPAELLEAPAGETNLCIGASSIYYLPESLDLTEVDTIVWHINPSAAGTITSVSGIKGSIVAVEWLPNFLPSPVQLMFSAQMSDGSSHVSKPLTVDLAQDIGRPPTPTGPTEITDTDIPSTFVADNIDGTEIEWLIPPGVGVLSSYDHYGNTVTVSWNQNLLGTYTITYKLRNNCGEWGAEAFPLYYSFPVAAPEGPDILCEEAHTCFTVPLYSDMASNFTWVLEPATAGYLESNHNEACVTLNKNAEKSNVVLYYKGLNNYSLPFQSPALTLTMNPLPATPARPAGLASIPWDIPSSAYTAEPGWDDYDWLILPSTAGTISQEGNTATVNWAGGTDHDYTGQVQISYRVKKNDNNCGFSNYSPIITVTLLPKLPTTDEVNPCAGTQTTFVAKTYIGASSYRWNIFPSSAGTVTSQANTATITWSSSYYSDRGADVSYSVVDAAGHTYTSETVHVNIHALPAKPGIAVGISPVNWNISASTYTADPGGDSYEWQIIPAAAGTITANGNSATIHWAGGSEHSYAGQVQVRYRITEAGNDCGYSEFSPDLSVDLLPKPPVTSDDNVCAGSRSVFNTLLYANASSYQWVVEPSEAGTVTSQNNTATIIWSPSYSGREAVVSYSVVDATGRTYDSETVTLNIHALPAKPGIAGGISPVNWNIPASTYTADPGGNSYEWQIIPAAAGTITANGNSATINWAGGSEHSYAGHVQVRYRITEAGNNCGYSEFSPDLSVDLLPKPPVTSDDHVCAGSRSVFNTLLYANASSYQWVVEPSEAGTVTNQANTATIIWSPSYSDRGADVSYAVIDASGRTYKSEAVRVNIHALPAKPIVASGINLVNWNTPASTYTAASGGDNYEWQIIPAVAGSITANGNSATIHWAGGSEHSYAGQVQVRYRITEAGNNCGYSEFSPDLLVDLLPKPPVTSDNNVCAGSRSVFNTLLYANASSYQWVVEPSDAGIVTNQANTAIIIWTPSYSDRVADVSYVVIDASGRTYKSEAVRVNIHELPAKPVVASGINSVSWNTPTSTYTAAPGGDSYEWQIIPAAAGTITATGISATIHWAGGSEHSYAGQVRVSYRITEAGNDCGFSEFSPDLLVNLLPKPPVTSDDNVCAGGRSTFNTLLYANASSYQWSVTPTNAGIITSQANTATITWSSSYLGQAEVSYSVTDATGRAYTSPPLRVTVQTTPPSMGIATGPSSVGWNEPASIFAVAASASTDELGYQWSLSQAAGIFSTPNNISPVTVTWNHQYAGIVHIIYQAHNNCGWSIPSKALPVVLQPAPPEIDNKEPCSGTSSSVSAPSYNNANANGYTWKLTPANSGTITNNGGNQASISWDPLFAGGLVTVEYTVAVGTAHYSSFAQVNVQPLPVSLAQTLGNTTVTYSESTTVYTASNGWEEYRWEISPVEASTAIQVDRNRLSVSWNKHYLGKVNISYKVQNACGWSPNSSPVQVVTLLPAPPVINPIACNETETSVSTQLYQNVSAYQWHISPSVAGQMIGNGHQAVVRWSNLYTGEAEISYTAANSAQESYSSSRIMVLVKEKPAKPPVASGPNRIYLNHPESTFYTTPGAGLQYEWMVTPSQAAEIQNPASETTSIIWNPIFFGKATIIYRVQNECGWSEMSEPFFVEVIQSDLGDIPGIFTPNNDGFNDTWDIPELSRYPEAKIWIFNRARRLMVELKGAQFPWDGRDRNGNILESGYYLYQIELQKGSKVVSGYVTILR